MILVRDAPVVIRWRPLSHDTVSSAKKMGATRELGAATAVAEVRALEPIALLPIRRL